MDMFWSSMPDAKQCDILLYILSSLYVADANDCTYLRHRHTVYECLGTNNRVEISVLQETSERKSYGCRMWKSMSCMRQHISLSFHRNATGVES